VKVNVNVSGCDEQGDAYFKECDTAFLLVRKIVLSYIGAVKILLK
jgi:hypothetical protein